MSQRTEPETVDRDERLGEAIEEYLALAETGEAPDPEQFAAGYPDLEDELREALQGLALVQGLVGAAGDGSRRLEAGRRVGGYRIVRELGRGGMGVVYEAVHVDLDRPVALKVLGAHAAPDSNSRRRFLNEAKTAAGLHHTHIVPVFDVGQVGGLCYYAMQRIEGCGLDRVLKVLRRGRSTGAGSNSRGSGSGSRSATRSATPSLSASAGLADAAAMEAAPWRPRGDDLDARRLGLQGDEAAIYEPPRGSAYYRWVAQVGRQAAEALAHAHKRGVIHRDVKPSNLLVDIRGTVWVADFGLARKLADPSLTQTDSLLGTPRYMSPEQAHGGSIDGRTDVYSLGATLYELLTLRPPFDGRSAAELVRQIGERDPVPPRRADPRLPRDLETIVLKAMAKRPADRYATVGELAEDLGRFLATEPVRARRIGPLGRLWRLTRRHPALSIVTTAAAATIIATATVAYVRVVQERDKALQAELKEKTAHGVTEMAKLSLQKTLRELELNQAQLLRASFVPDRRERGLTLLRQAAARDSGPALRQHLRDEAVEFLAMRDVVARPDIATGPAMDIAPVPGADRLGVISADGAEFSLIDLATGRRVGAAQGLRVGAAEPEADGPGPGPRPGGGPGRNGLLHRERLASIGPALGAVWANGQGIRLFDPVNGTKLVDMETPEHQVVELLANRRGDRLITIDRAPDPRPGRRGDREREPERDRDRRPGPPGNWNFRVHLWDISRDGGPIATLGEPDAESAGSGLPLVALGPDDRTIAVKVGERQITLYSAEDGSALGEPIEAPAAVWALALGPDGLLAAAGGGTIWLWDGPTRRQLPGLGQHQGFVRLMRFSPERGALLAVAGAGPGVELWDLAGGTLVAALKTPDRVQDLAFLPGPGPGLRLLATSGASALAWDVVEPAVRSRLSEPESRPLGVAFGPCGRLAALFRSGPQSGSVRVWDPDQCPSKAWGLPDSRGLWVAFDHAGRLGVLDGEGLAWFEPPEAQPALRADLPGSHWGGRGVDPRLVAQSHDRRVLVLARGPDLLLWDDDHPDAVRRLLPPGVAFEPPLPQGPPRLPGPGGRPGPGPIGPRPRFWMALALAPAGDRLYLLDSDHRLHAWALDRNRRRARDLGWPAAAGRWGDQLALSADGRTLAVTVAEPAGSVALIDAARGTIRARLARSEPGEKVTTLRFAPAGDLLAVGTQQGATRLWSLRGPFPEPVLRLPDHRGPVMALAFAPDVPRLAIADERAVDVWDLAGVRDQLRSLGLDW